MMQVFDRLDELLESKSLRELIILYSMIILSIGFVLIYYVLPYTQKLRDDFKSKNHKLMMSIKLKKQLRIGLTNRVVIVHKKAKEYKLELQKLKIKRDFFRDLIANLYFIKFDKYKWGEFVKNIVVNANKLSLNVLNLTTDFLDIKDSGLQKRMEIEVSLYGDYKDFIKFIYNYENRKEFIRVESIDVLDKSNFKVKFAMYGYNK